MRVLSAGLHNSKSLSNKLTTCTKFPKFNLLINGLFINFLKCTLVKKFPGNCRSSSFSRKIFNLIKSYNSATNEKLIPGNQLPFQKVNKMLFKKLKFCFKNIPFLPLMASQDCSLCKPSQDILTMTNFSTSNQRFI